MTPPLVEVADRAAEARWAEWQARGVDSDRRNGRIMVWFFAVILTVLVGLLLSQLL
jgi:hypothetical protein